MKYDKHHRDKIISALENGEGRVRACKAAGLGYDAFLDWYNNKPEFTEMVKNAEDIGNDKIKDLAKRGIIEKFQSTWQAAAWWLERNYPDEFKLRTDISDEDRKRITKLFIDEPLPEERKPKAAGIRNK